MYRKDKPINLKGSTSSLCNNLSVYVMPDKRQLNYCTVHKSVINIACATTDGSSVTGRHVICKEPSATQGVPFVTQAKWTILPSRAVLVLTTQRGIQIYEQDGSAMLYWHALSDSMESSNFAKGIAGVGDNLVCVGTEEGCILVFKIPEKGSNITQGDTIKGHKSPICDMISADNILVSGDEMGIINVWKYTGSHFAKTTTISGDGWPCNTLSLWHDVIVAGYASGHIRVFSATSGKIGGEVTAHARAVNAVDVATENGMVMSVSDDTFFRIWQLKKGNVPQIEYRSAENVQDLQLVGGKFIDGQGRALCISGYDNSDLHFFIRS